MKNYYFFATFLAVLLLSACSPLSPVAGLQTAVAETQAAMPTQTAYPTYTPFQPTHLSHAVPDKDSFHRIILYPPVPWN